MITHSAILAALAELRTTAEATPVWARTDWHRMGGAVVTSNDGIQADRGVASTNRHLPYGEQDTIAEHRLLQERISHDPADGPGDYPWVERCLAGCGPYPCGVLTGLATALGLEET